LTNVLEQCLLNAGESRIIMPENLPPSVLEKGSSILRNSFSLKGILEETEKQIIRKTLNFTRRNKRMAQNY
jgi:transcriptional regulator with PAS, ATPase and Fis domain